MRIRYELCMRSQDVTERDINRMIPHDVNTGYKYAFVTMQSNPDPSHGFRVRDLVRDTLYRRNVPATMRGIMFTYVGEPMIAVDLED